MQIDPATLAFVARLVDAAPELRPLYAEHLADDDELLPHVFMGDVSRFVEALHKQALAPAEDADAAEEVLRRILAPLDEGIATGPDEVQELVSVSFLENVAELAWTSPAFRARLPGALERQLEVILASMGFR